MVKIKTKILEVNIFILWQIEGTKTDNQWKLSRNPPNEYKSHQSYR
jgi:hypothetical protein